MQPDFKYIYILIYLYLYIARFIDTLYYLYVARL